MLGIRNFLKPKHTTLSVVQELVQGLESGTIVLDHAPLKMADKLPSEASKLPSTRLMKSRSDYLALLKIGVEEWNQWRRQNPEKIPNLSRANFDGADLKEVDLSRADLNMANLSKADLSRADLSRATLIRTNLRGADLSRAALSSTYLNGADLKEADLRGATLSRATLRLANLGKADLRGADLGEANLRLVNFSKANLRLTNLSKAELSGANFSEAIVEQAVFKGSRGLTPDQIISLKARGAIFDDFSGSLAHIYVKR
jgi:uncharacterized protein YjbI with pentapeptide repeats